MHTCQKCQRTFKNKGSLGNHQRFCTGEAPKREKYRTGPFVCPKCGRTIKTSHNAHVARCDGSGKMVRDGRFTGKGQGWTRGKTYEDAFGKEKADEYRKKLREKEKNKPSTWSKMSDSAKAEFREKMRLNMLRRYSEGWEGKGGRCKKLIYESPIAGKVFLDGTWELAVAQYFDMHNFQWTRNKKRFKYIKPDGKESTYCPDFYIADTDTYIEVKGYERDIDRYKWAQFPHNIEIWKEEKLRELGIKVKS